jgi:hypothetical protein
MAAPGAGTYADVEALGALRARLVVEGIGDEGEIVGALNAFLSTSGGEIEGALNEKAATAGLGAVAAINELLGSELAFEVNDGLRQLAESYTP